MYEPFFGFHRRPFSTAPDPGCFFAGESVRDVLSELTTCVERGQGIALLTAPAGMGKSLLCQRLISNLKAQFATIYLGNANFPTRRSLLQAILLELGDEYSRSDEAELRHTLQKRLHGLRRQHEALLLVVDESHLFESDLLEEIRTLADIAAEGQPLVRIVLSGQLELEERLTDRRFDALNQRLGTHAYLEPLTQNESAEYLHHRIEQSGGDAESVFTEEGFSIIVRASGGVPRCLNQLADHSLLLAFAADEKPVKEKTVRDALDDLKQLPLHWNDVSEPVSSSTFEPEDDFGEPADDDFTDATAEVAQADSGVSNSTLEFAAEDDFSDKGEFADEAAAATFEFEASSPTEAPQDASSTGEVAEFETGEFDLPPANTAALAAAADVFEETEEFGEVADQNSDTEATDSLSLAEESSFEAAWEATYDSDEQPPSEETATVEFAAEDLAAEETDTAQQTEDAGQSEAGDPWFAGVEPQDSTPSSDTSPVEVVTESEEDSPTADTAVLEFGAEQDTADEEAEVATAETEPVAVDECEVSEQQPASPEASGETSVEAVLSATPAFTEIFVVDHYSAIEEPLSADIAWPESAHFRREDEACIDAEPEVVEEPPQLEAHSEPASEVTDDAWSESDTTEDVPVENAVAAETEVSEKPETDSEPTSVFEFSAQQEPAVEDEPLDSTAGEFGAVENSEDEKGQDAVETVDEEAVAETDDTEQLVSHESPETMFEFGVDPSSVTDFETDKMAEATFEQAQELLSEFGSSNESVEAGSDIVDEASAEADSDVGIEKSAQVEEESETEAAVEFPVRNVDVSQSIATIDGMLEELSYDADDVGQAVDDASDEPERPSIEIESELLRTVDHSADPEREIEDEIGATMLDICLDTQSAIYQMTQQLRESSAARDVVEEQSEDDLPHIADVDPSVFDVVEPEAEAEEVSEPAQPSSQTPTADRSQPPKKRAFGSLFSDLRRRQG
jgi:type II secretory pathway predicted ATPase ExeA